MIVPTQQKDKQEVYDKSKAAKKCRPEKINTDLGPDRDEAAHTARTALRPSVQAAVTIKNYGKSYGDLDLACLIDSLLEQIKANSDGDMERGGLC